jgi:S1-C subfamily serine protease
VEPDSFADDALVQPNDIITQINRQPVTSKEELVKIQSTLKPGQTVLIRVMRATGRNQQWSSTYLTGTLPANGQ